MSTQEIIIQKLQALSPEHLEVINESHMHNVPEDSESHFKVVIVSDAFKDKMLIARHRMVNKALEKELAGGIHALALHTMTMEEWFEKGNAPESPPCLGGGAKSEGTSD
jgi:BolA protein